MSDMGDISDGHHTFNELYRHRAVLFSYICSNEDSANVWKSKLHSDGTMFDGMFVVGMDTPFGPVSYHYDVDPYWELFDIREIDRAPEWDGYSPNDVIDRLVKCIESKKESEND